MFRHVLALPASERERFAAPALRTVLHGGEPCPPELKRQMIEWWGPIFTEYFGFSEGGVTFATTAEWLSKPGTVGKPPAQREVLIAGAEGEPLPPGKEGVVYFRFRTDNGRTSARFFAPLVTVVVFGVLGVVTGRGLAWWAIAAPVAMVQLQPGLKLADVRFRGQAPLRARTAREASVSEGRHSPLNMLVMPFDPSSALLLGAALPSAERPGASPALLPVGAGSGPPAVSLSCANGLSSTPGSGGFRFRSASLRCLTRLRSGSSGQSGLFLALTASGGGS